MQWKRFLPAALAIAAGTGTGTAQTATPIQHVVVIFQENVSFDHYFATYPNAANPGSQPVFVPHNVGNHPTPSINGLSGPLMTHNPNSVQPFRLDRSQAIICDQDHDYTAEQKAMDGGLMDQFVNLLGVTVCWFSVKWRAGASVSEYSASHGGPSGDWNENEKAADGDCNWFRK